MDLEDQILISQKGFPRLHDELASHVLSFLCHREMLTNVVRLSTFFRDLVRRPNSWSHIRLPHGCRIDDANFAKLLPLWSHAKLIHLPSCNILTAATSMLLESFTTHNRFPFLTDLSFDSCQWLIPSSLCALLKSSPNLTALNLSTTRDIDSSVLRTLFTLPSLHLQTLNLSQQIFILDELRTRISFSQPKDSDDDPSPSPQGHCSDYKQSNDGFAVPVCDDLSTSSSCSSSSSSDSSSTSTSNAPKLRSALARRSKPSAPVSSDSSISTSSLSATSSTSIPPPVALLSLQHLHLPFCVTLSDDAVTFFVQSSGASLLTLDVSSCVRVSTRALLAIAAHCPNLQHLALTR